ncbi:MAG TPA: alpha/beta fold hydrolase, partial [Rubrivivax sp.]|nr:alpha/beta fold hydrolase [Rubrivivax sp.]
MRTRRRWLIAAAAALASGAAAVFALHRRDMRLAYARIAAGSQRLDSPWGDVEFTTGSGAGVGTPVLVVHGSGGGFDQGALVARTLIDDGRRWIAPSRFGYLRSALPAGAGFAEQADAFAWLVEQLGLGRVHVLALSHGGPSALWLALRHPRRVASLTLLSAGVTALPVADQRAADRKGPMLTAIYPHDL